MKIIESTITVQALDDMENHSRETDKLIAKLEGNKTTQQKTVNKTELHITQADFKQIKRFQSAAKKMMRLMRKNFRAEMEQLRVDLTDTLDNKKDAYVWAITYYSADNLATFDELTRNHLKLILRDYFANLGQSYEGWN